MVGVTAKTQNFRKNAKVLLTIILLFLYASPAEGIRPLEKEAIIKEKEEKLFVEETLDEAMIEDIDNSPVASEILYSIKEFEKEKEEIIKQQRLNPGIVAPAFKIYIAPSPVFNPIDPLSEKKAVLVSKAIPKKKNILFDIIFFAVILALFFSIKTMLKPAKYK